MYVYIYGCICVGLSVCCWMGAQGEDLIFEVVPECLEDLLIVYIGVKTTQRAVLVKTCKTRKEG